MEIVSAVAALSRSTVLAAASRDALMLGNALMLGKDGGGGVEVGLDGGETGGTICGEGGGVEGGGVEGGGVRHDTPGQHGVAPISVNGRLSPISPAPSPLPTWVSCPSCPFALAPQHFSRPSVVTAQAC